MLYLYVLMYRIQAGSLNIFFIRQLMFLASRDGEWLQWLVFCVGLTGLRGAQKAGKTFFLGVSVRVCLDKVSICTGRMRKEDCSHQRGWASSSPGGPGLNKKAEEG